MRRSRRVRQHQAYIEADTWNAAYPVGYLVRYWRGSREADGHLGVTRSKACVLESTAIVFIQGVTPGLPLDHVEPVEQAVTK